jgi:hypothetical protein
MIEEGDEETAADAQVEESFVWQLVSLLLLLLLLLRLLLLFWLWLWILLLLVSLAE